MRALAAALLMAMFAGCAAPPAGVEPPPAAAPPDPVDVLRRAVNLMESRKYERAIAALTGLLERQAPSDAAATHYLLGSAYGAANDPARAAKHYAMAADNPGDMTPDGTALAQLGAGHYAFLAGRYQEAVRHLAAWRRSAADVDPATLMELAQAHFRLEQSADALEIAEAALRMAQTQGEEMREEWLAFLVDLYAANEQWDQSLAMQDRLQQEFPIRPERRDRRRALLPDTATLEALQAQTRALLAR